jgi:gamma-glutamyl:cysteine ligase YbdK (ATP-grasp superfamily)
VRGAAARPLGLFEGYGIELEYMLVRADSLAVLPASDEALRAVTGAYTTDWEDGPVVWSNELALHVIELKTNGPVPSLSGWAARFQAEVARLNSILAPLGGRLMPTAMHPTMDPRRETRLWPHDLRPLYEAYDRIFGCRAHGWANLQSCHLNLPFRGDREFGRLHAAVRVVLPLLPALAASSPIAEGRGTGLLDTRLEVYRTNQARIPSLTGQVIPEPVFGIAAYRDQVLARLYADVAPFDPEGVLCHEFLNSRGAVPRFERDAIEIRLLDVQEAPVADLAVAHLVSETVKALVGERWAAVAELERFPVDALAPVLLETIRDGDEAVVTDRALLAAFGAPAGRLSAGDLWRHLAEAVLPARGGDPELRAALGVILERGPLARRILRAVGRDVSPARIASVYRALSDCLAAGTLFDA